MVICLERGANDLHVVKLMPLPPRHLLLQQNPEWFILLVPAYPGCPGKKAVKWLCVCVCVSIFGKKVQTQTLAASALPPGKSLSICSTGQTQTPDQCLYAFCWMQTV